MRLTVAALAAIAAFSATPAHAGIHLNALQPNALQPNALQPNALQPNAITLNAITLNAITLNAITLNGSQLNCVDPCGLNTSSMVRSQAAAVQPGYAPQPISVLAIELGDGTKLVGSR